MDFIYSDGGRAAAGYSGTTGDCVVRSIAIANDMPYKQVYDDLFEASRTYGETRRNKRARRIQKRGASPRNGVHKPVYEKYLSDLGWTWVPTMSIGSGCTVHLKSDELPGGTLIVSVSRHMTCVCDGIIYDLYDCSRNGTRCVYGYFKRDE